MVLNIQEFINNLLGQGRYSFTIQEVENTLSINKIASLNALKRLKQKNLIASPARGLYLIVPPQYQAYGCLPAELFASDLMRHLDLPYYVGYLSAAQFYGAAHQKPQRFQVVTTINRRPIHCGRIYIEFIANKNMAGMPTQSFNTETGTILVATPEVVALDLVSSPQRGAGINNVATVLTELSETIDLKRLLELTKINNELSWVQRLGYLFDSLDLNQIANVLTKILDNKNLHWVPLVARASYKALERNSKWKVIVNAQVEPDE